MTETGNHEYVAAIAAWQNVGARWPCWRLRCQKGVGDFGVRKACSNDDAREHQVWALLGAWMLRDITTFIWYSIYLLVCILQHPVTSIMCSCTHSHALGEWYISICAI